SPIGRSYVSSSRLQAWIGLAGQDAVEVAGEVALDAAADFPVGLALGPAALHVGMGGGVAPHPADGDDLQGAVELAAGEAVERIGPGDDRGAGRRGAGSTAAGRAGQGPSAGQAGRPGDGL